MADVKREVRALGQMIVGLKAGDKVTLVMKRPKPKVDATNAKQAQRIAQEHTQKAQSAISRLQDAQRSAHDGDRESARKVLSDVREIHNGMLGAISESGDWAKRAADDEKNSPGEVKQEYTVAKEGGEQAVKLLEEVAKTLDKAISAVGAVIEERGGR